MKERLNNLIKELESLPRHNNKWSGADMNFLINDFTYHSTKIEGLKMTYGDTIAFLTTGLIKKQNSVKDLADLVNHKSVLTTIFETYSSIKIDSQKILDIHRELMKDPRQWQTEDEEKIKPGRFKEGVNHGYRGSGKFKEYMMSAFVPSSLERAIETYYSQLKDERTHPLEAISQFHYTFLNVIHPFEDGNGRVGRLLMAVQQLQNGLPIAYPDAEKKGEYVKAIIDSEESGEITHLVNFMVDLSLIALQNKREKNEKLPFLEEDVPKRNRGFKM